MPVENIPWAIEGGKHTAGAARRVLHKGTGGAEGVAGFADLRVRQAAVANGTVIVSAGGAVMVSRYAGVRGESYDGENLSDTVLNVTANGSGALRYDLVIARIDDWNFPGQQAKPASLPTDTVPAFKLAVITGVSAATRTAKELNLGYPAIALARIALPAATSAVTQAMILDLRKKVNPLRERFLGLKSIPNGSTSVLDKTQAQGDEIFPVEGSWTVDVPEWATRLKLKLDFNALVAPPGGGAAGYLWARIGAGRSDAFITETTQYDTTTSTSYFRFSTAVVAELAVPKAMRGQTISIQSWGRYVNGDAGKYISADWASNVSLDVEWVEAPTEDV